MSAPQRNIGFLPVIFLLTFAQPAWCETLATGGTGWSLGIAQILGTTFTDRTGIKVSVARSLGSGGGVQAVLEGAFGISFAARPPKEVESSEGAVFHALCRTPFVLAISEIVEGELRYSTSDILDLYDRKISHWPDRTQIRLVLRPVSETGSRMLVENFPGIEPILARERAARGAIIAHTDQEAMDVGEQTVGSLVTSTLVAIRSEKRFLRSLTIDDVAPSMETLNDGSYSMAITLYSVLGPSSGAPARKFLDFIVSVDGRRILRENGCIPIDR